MILKNYPVKRRDGEGKMWYRMKNETMKIHEYSEMRNDAVSKVNGVHNVT